MAFGQDKVRREVLSNIGSKHIQTDRTKEKSVAEVVVWGGTRTRALGEGNVDQQQRLRRAAAVAGLLEPQGCLLYG